MEKQFQSAYTIAKFKEFHSEFVGQICYSLSPSKSGDVLFEYEIKENVSFEGKCRRVTFTVCFKECSNEATCSCRLFEFRGILCRHQIMVFIYNGIEQVPEQYILRRWSKTVKRSHTKIRINYEDSSFNNWSTSL